MYISRLYPVYWLTIDPKFQRDIQVEWFSFREKFRFPAIFCGAKIYIMSRIQTTIYNGNSLRVLHPDAQCMVYLIYLHLLQNYPNVDK